MYDKPGLQKTYTFIADLGAAFARRISPPASGVTGVIRSVHLAADATEAIAPGGASLDLGTAADDDAYYTEVFSDVAVSDSAADAGSEGNAGVWKDRLVPADTPIEVSNSAAFTTGANATVSITIDWNMPEPRVSYG